MQSNGHSSPRRRNAHFKHNHGVVMTDLLEEEESQTNDEKSFGLGSTKSIIALEIFCAFIWWTVFQGSVPLLCHPHSNMLSKISIPYLFHCLVWSSPLLLLVGMVRTAVSTSSGLLALRLILLAGAASFQLHEPSAHAVGMGLSLVAAILILYVKLWPISKIDRHRNIYYHFLGLILTLALRILFSSINPLFFSATLNTLLLIAGTVAAFALYILDWRTPIIRKKEYSRFVQIFSDSYEEVNEDSWSGAMWAGAGFGFLLFVLQSVFANTTIILSWANLPSSKGTAVSFPLDVLVTLPLSLGVLLSRDQYRHLLTAGQWLFLGITGFLLPSVASSSAALLGQAFLAIYVSSLWTQLCQRMSQFPANRTLTIALFVHFTTLLFSSALYHLHHWITYAFIITAIVLVWYSFRLYVNSLEDGQSEAQQFERMAMRRVSYVTMFGRTIRRLSTLIEEDEEIEEGNEEEDEEIDEIKSIQDFTAQKDMVRQLLMCESNEMKLFDQKVVMTILFLGVFSAFGSIFWQLNLHHAANQASHQHIMGENMSVMVWDLTGNQDYNMYQNQSLDVLCLTGSSNPYADTGDPAKWIGVINRMEVVHGPCLHLHCKKVTLLSQIPLLRSEKLVLYTDKGAVAAVGVQASLKHNSLSVFCMDMKTNSYSELVKAVKQSASDLAVLLVHSSSGSSSPVSDFKSAEVDTVSKCSKSTGIYFQSFDQVSSTVCSLSNETSSSSIWAQLRTIN